MNPAIHLDWVRDNAARQALIAAHPEAALVSVQLPLRANLTVLENIAIVPQYRDNLPYADAADLAWNLLHLAGHTECAYQRDPDLDHVQRFVAKFLRALVAGPSVILIDRPGYLLPDCHPPSFIAALLAKLEAPLTRSDTRCLIVDYPWNEPLYAPR